MNNLLIGLFLSATVLGPLNAEVVRVIDGDTIVVSIEVLPRDPIVRSVRLRGVDTPETRTAKCPDEKAAGLRAKAFLDRLVRGKGLVLRNIKAGKYYGRVVADVYLADGLNLVTLLLDGKYGRPYAGGKRQGWCS